MDDLAKLLEAWHVTPGWISLALILGRILGEGITSLRNGSGLIGAWRSIMYGQNVPKPIAQDYKAELAQKKSDPPDNPS